MDYVMREDPGDYLLDDEVDCIEDAEEDILTDDSSDIDRVGEITDETPILNILNYLVEKL